MLAAFTLALFVAQAPQPKAEEILRQMLDALAPVHSASFTVESELPTGGKPCSYQAAVIASDSPNRYWAKLQGDEPLGIQYVGWDGKKLLATNEETGKREEYAIDGLQSIVNSASTPGYEGWKVFFSRQSYRDALAGGALYVHPEAIEGVMCDVVGVPYRKKVGAEEMAGVKFMWVSQSDHLPRAFQLFFLVRGNSSASPKMRFHDIKLNPEIATGAFANVPALVPRAVVHAPAALGEPVALSAGHLVPSLPVQNAQYKSLKLPSLVSGRTLVTFWAPWCGPCQGEMKALAERPEVKSGRLKVVAVGVSDSKQNIAAYIAKSTMPFTFVMDPDCEKKTSKLESVFGVSGIPHAFLCDGKGKIVRQWIGFSDAKALSAELR